MRGYASDRYVLDGHTPVEEPDLMTWARWFEASGEERQVGLDLIGDVTVSTVFLALDFSFGGPAPVLFETIARRTGSMDLLEHERYATWEAAAEGHARVVAKLREAR